MENEIKEETRHGWTKEEYFDPMKWSEAGYDQYHTLWKEICWRHNFIPGVADVYPDKMVILDSGCPNCGGNCADHTFDIDSALIIKCEECGLNLNFNKACSEIDVSTGTITDILNMVLAYHQKHSRHIEQINKKLDALSKHIGIVDENEEDKLKVA